MNTANAKNRGYLKIESAARAFNFDFKNKVVLDIGSSTGGFTQFALDHGAAKVIAVEKGTNQMVSPLRFDPRIELHEKTDIFNVGSGTQIVSPEGIRSAAARGRAPAARGFCTAGRGPMEKSICVPDIIVADVSFISLTKILKHAKTNLANKDTAFLVMLKPQFEASSNQLHNGVVKNETIRREIIKNFESWLKQNGFLVVKKHDNDLKGKTGNRERFYYLKLAK